MLQVAEPIQLGVPLSDFLASYKQGRTFVMAGNENFVIPFIRGT